MSGLTCDEVHPDLRVALQMAARSPTTAEVAIELGDCDLLCGCCGGGLDEYVVITLTAENADRWCPTAVVQCPCGEMLCDLDLRTPYSRSSIERAPGAKSAFANGANLPIYVRRWLRRQRTP